MCSRKKKSVDDGSSGNAPAWMALYATLMTLLMAFFVVLSTMGTFGGHKFHKAAVSLKRAFTIYPSGGFGMLKKKSASVGSVKPHFKVRPTKMVVKLAGSEVEKTLKNTVEEGVQDIQVIYLEDGSVLLKIPEVTFFDRGTAVVKKSSFEFLNNIIRLFKDQPYNIVVSGHTDEILEPGFLYSSNWELSAMRSANIVRYLHENGKIEYNVLRPVGYSQYRPAAGDFMGEDRLRNSRIEILLEKIEDYK